MSPTNLARRIVEVHPYPRLLRGRGTRAAVGALPLPGENRSLDPSSSKSSRRDCLPSVVSVSLTMAASSHVPETLTPLMGPATHVKLAAAVLSQPLRPHRTTRCVRAHVEPSITSASTG
jgi:hypothetical protein